MTVVIPNYNGIKYISDCISSLLRDMDTCTDMQEGQQVQAQIIVVDNGSADGSYELVRDSFAANDGKLQNHPVTLLRLSANTGFCHAVNAGIHITRTSYVILLNNDTCVRPGFIRTLTQFMESHPRAFSAQARMLDMHNPDVIDDAGDLFCCLGWAFARGKGKPANAHRYNRIRKIFSACGGAAIYRMEIFEQIGLFDERHFCYLEDVDIGWRALLAGYDNYYVPQAEVLHAGSASTGSRHNPFKELMTAGNCSYLIYKNMPALQYALNYPMIRIGIAIKRAYFRKKGLGAAYESGIARGGILRWRAALQMQALMEDDFYAKDMTTQEACLPEENQNGLENFYPMYLGTKVPFFWRAVPDYFRIQWMLIRNTFLRLAEAMNH